MGFLPKVLMVFFLFSAVSAAGDPGKQRNILEFYERAYQTEIGASNYLKVSNHYGYRCFTQNGWCYTNGQPTGTRCYCNGNAGTAGP